MWFGIKLGLLEGFCEKNQGVVKSMGFSPNRSVAFWQIVGVKECVIV